MAYSILEKKWFLGHDCNLRSSTLTVTKKNLFANNLNSWGKYTKSATTL